MGCLPRRECQCRESRDLTCVFTVPGPRRDSANEPICTGDWASSGCIGQVSTMGQVILTSCAMEKLSSKGILCLSPGSASWNSDSGARPKALCFGSVAISLMSCYVPVASLLVLDLEVENFGGLEAAALGYTRFLKRRLHLFNSF